MLRVFDVVLTLEVRNGDLLILDITLIGFFCSVYCPGDAILKTYDLARMLRETDVTIVGDFQAPMEKECLDLLLRGSVPMVVCPARGLAGCEFRKAGRDRWLNGTCDSVLFRRRHSPAHSRSCGQAQSLCRRARRPPPHCPCRKGRQNRGIVQGSTRRWKVGICHRLPR